MASRAKWVRFGLALIASWVAPDGGIQAQYPHEVVGSAAADWAGRSVVAVGDVDADGYADVAYGASNASAAGVSRAGYVAVISGKTRAVLWSRSTNVGDGFGRSIDRVSDLNGDGKDDLICGTNMSSNGYVELLSGATGALVAHVCPPVQSGRFGFSVCRAGDVNGDGKEDVLVGDPGPASANGERVTWISGQWLASQAPGPFSSGSIAVMLAPVAGEFGDCVTRAGDLNGDGSAEFLVGAPLAPGGRAVVVDGATIQTNPTVLWTLGGGQHDSRFGGSVAGVGDVDGDGKGDFAIGDPLGGPAGAGRVKLFAGATAAPSLLRTYDGTAASDRFGASVLGVGDIDFDGLADFAIGDPGDGNQSARNGTVHLYSSYSRNPIRSYTGRQAAEIFGICMARVDACGRDATAQLAIGAPLFDLGAASLDNGRVQLVPLATRPGTGEDLSLRTASAPWSPIPLPALPPLRGFPDLVTPSGGDLIAIQVASDCGRFHGVPPVLMGQVFPTTGPPPNAIGGVIHIDPAFSNPPLVIFAGCNVPPPLGPMVLAPGGLTLTFATPLGLGGTSLVLQAVVVTGLAANGNYATSHAHVIRF